MAGRAGPGLGRAGPSQAEEGWAGLKRASLQALLGSLWNTFAKFCNILRGSTYMKNERIPFIAPQRAGLAEKA